MLNQTVMKMTEKAKQEAKLFYDLLEVCEGIDDSRIDVISSKKESELLDTFLLKKGNQSYFIQKFTDVMGAPVKLTMDNCTLKGEKAVIKNNGFSSRIMTISEEFVNINLQDIRNDLNEILEFNIGLDHSGDILYSQIKKQEMLFIPESKSISGDMINKVTSSVMNKVIPFDKER